CLRDFTGVNDPHAVAALAEMLVQFDSDAAGLCDPEWDGFGGGGRGEYAWELEAYLARVASVCRVSGWVSRKAARESEGWLPGSGKQATADTVAYLLNLCESSEGYRDAVAKYGKHASAEDEATAGAALEWARALG